MKGKHNPPPPSKPKLPPTTKQLQHSVPSTSSTNTSDGKQKQMQQVPTPTKPALNANLKPVPNQSHKPPPPRDTLNPSAKPNINLPPGWICVWSKSQRRWYYFNSRTNKSVWEWPPPS